MTLILDMLACNVRLSEWKQYDQEIKTGKRKRTLYHRGKDYGKTAQVIYSQLSHPETVEIVAKEYVDFDPELRLRFNDLCNKGNCSATVAKKCAEIKSNAKRENIGSERKPDPSSDG